MLTADRDDAIKHKNVLPSLALIWLESLNHAAKGMVEEVYSQKNISNLAISPHEINCATWLVKNGNTCRKIPH